MQLIWQNCLPLFWMDFAPSETQGKSLENANRVWVTSFQKWNKFWGGRCFIKGLLKPPLFPPLLTPFCFNTITPFKERSFARNYAWNSQFLPPNSDLRCFLSRTSNPFPFLGGPRLQRGIRRRRPKSAIPTTTYPTPQFRPSGPLPGIYPPSDFADSCCLIKRHAPKELYFQEALQLYFLKGAPAPSGSTFLRTPSQAPPPALCDPNPLGVQQCNLPPLAASLSCAWRSSDVC